MSTLPLLLSMPGTSAQPVDSTNEKAVASATDPTLVGRFTGLLGDLLPSGNGQALADSSGKSLPPADATNIQRIVLNQRVSIITGTDDGPDEEKLLAFARAQGIGENALRELMLATGADTHALPPAAPGANQAPSVASTAAGGSAADLSRSLAGAAIAAPKVDAPKGDAPGADNLDLSAKPSMADSIGASEIAMRAAPDPAAPDQGSIPLALSNTTLRSGASDPTVQNPLTAGSNQSRPASRRNSADDGLETATQTDSAPDLALLGLLTPAPVPAASQPDPAVMSATLATPPAPDATASAAQTPAAPLADASGAVTTPLPLAPAPVTNASLPSNATQHPTIAQTTAALPARLPSPAGDSNRNAGAIPTSQPPAIARGTDRSIDSPLGRLVAQAVTAPAPTSQPQGTALQIPSAAAAERPAPEIDAAAQATRAIMPRDAASDAAAAVQLASSGSRASGADRQTSGRQVTDGATLRAAFERRASVMSAPARQQANQTNPITSMTEANAEDAEVASIPSPVADASVSATGAEAAQAPMAAPAANGTLDLSSVWPDDTPESADPTADAQMSARFEQAAAQAGQGLANQIGQAVRSGNWHLDIQITPRHLGHIEIALQANADGQIDARLSAAESRTRSLLDASVTGLRESLGSAGITAGHIEVTQGDPARGDTPQGNQFAGSAWQGNENTRQGAQQYTARPELGMTDAQSIQGPSSPETDETPRVASTGLDGAGQLDVRV